MYPATTQWILWEFVVKLNHIEVSLWLLWKEPTGDIVITLQDTFERSLNEGSVSHQISYNPSTQNTLRPIPNMLECCQRSFPLIMSLWEPSSASWALITPLTSYPSGTLQQGCFTSLTLYQPSRTLPPLRSPPSPQRHSTYFHFTFWSHYFLFWMLVSHTHHTHFLNHIHFTPRPLPSFFPLWHHLWCSFFSWLVLLKINGRINTFHLFQSYVYTCLTYIHLAHFHFAGTPQSCLLHWGVSYLFPIVHSSHSYLYLL